MSGAWLPLGVLLTSIIPFCFIKRRDFSVRLSQLWLVALLAAATYYAFHTAPTATFTYSALHFDQLHLDIVLGFDHLTKLMLIFILFIGLLIYSYAKTYLLSDTTRLRFLAQLSLVLFSVVLLVMAANLLTAFVAWQLISMGLYQLLNHYHYDQAANKAAKKKIVINRLGDCCFLLAVIIAYHTQQSSLFVDLQYNTSAHWICGLVFVAVMSKCAQFPFHVWLIDTMETPTPVSALMHAGVINAGGILLTRISGLLIHQPTFLMVILGVGLLTALLSTVWMRRHPATKQQLAYSTMGQMGYMITQCSLGAFPAAVFHLISHGFFKASLFLNAGETLQNQRPIQRALAVTQLLNGFLISVIVFLPILALSTYLHVHISILMYGFLFMTILSVMVKALQSTLRWRQWVAIAFGTLVLGLIYCYLLNGVTLLLKHYEYKPTVSITTQCIILLVLFGLQSIFWLHPIYHKNPGVHDKTEALLRQILLNPLRELGDFCNRYIVKFTTVIGFVILLVMLHVFAPQWMLLGILAFLLVILITANRSPKLAQLIMWIALFQVLYLCLAWTDGGPALTTIGFFHFCNVAGVLLMLALLISKRSTTTLQPLHFKNKLPVRIFYVMFGLLLLIGIPGTASFISEFYLLNALLFHGVLIALLFLLVIILLSIVIMHALQLYVFNNRYTGFLAAPLHPVWHVLFCAIIGFNIVSGIDPGLLLQHLARLQGGG